MEDTKIRDSKFDEIDEIDLEDINNKKKIHNKLSLNLEYITERANSSMFVSKLLDDESDNIINDQKTYDQLGKIIDNIKKDMHIISDDKNINNINFYDLGYNMGVMKEILPDNYHKFVINIRAGIVKNDWKRVQELIDNLITNFLSNE